MAVGPFRTLQRLKGIMWGVQYKPRKGDAVMFYSMHPNGTFDKHALHGGCPVKKGTKWVSLPSAAVDRESFVSSVCFMVMQWLDFYE